MLFIIHLTLNIWNISNQNVFLYVLWHFLSGEVKNVQISQSGSKETFFQAKRSQAVFLARPVFSVGAGSFYVVS